MSTLVREIGYSPLKSQLLFHQCRARYKLFSGSVGSGKSAALVHEALRLSFVNHGLLGLIGAPTYRILHDTTERAFFEVLNSNHIPYRHNKSDKECLLTDFGSRIIFRTLDDATRLVGTNLAWFGIDECGYATEAAFLRLQARLREPKSRELCGMGATTPNGLNWVYDRWIGEKKTADYEIIRAVPGENTFLPPDFYATLARSYDPRFYRQEVLGDYLSLQSGTAYHAFDRSRSIDPHIQRRHESQLCIAADYNLSPMSWMIAQIVDNAPNVYTSSQETKVVEVLEESIIRDCTIDLACSAICARLMKYRRPGQRLQVHFYGDSSGNNRNHAGDTNYALIRRYFAMRSEFELIFHVPSSNPAIRDRVNAVNAALYNASGQIRLTVAPECKALIKDFERVTWAQDAHGNMLEGFSKKDPNLIHASDAIGYLIASVFPLRGGNAGFKSTRII